MTWLDLTLLSLGLIVMWGLISGVETLWHWISRRLR